MNYLAYNKLAGGVSDEKIREITTKYSDRFPNMELINSVCPGDGNEILSMDISVDKKYCYIWMENNKIYDAVEKVYSDDG